MKNSSFHVAFFIGKFIYLMRYSMITQFRSCLILVSMIFFDSNIIFLTSSSSNKIVLSGIVTDHVL
jgi:hypothetical protein